MIGFPSHDVADSIINTLKMVNFTMSSYIHNLFEIMKSLSILFLLFALIIASCTIQKRIHRPGWDVQWKKNYRSTDSSETEGEKLYPTDHEEAEKIYSEADKTIPKKKEVNAEAEKHELGEIHNKTEKRKSLSELSDPTFLAEFDEDPLVIEELVIQTELEEEEPEKPEQGIVWLIIVLVAFLLIVGGAFVILYGVIEGSLAAIILGLTFVIVGLALAFAGIALTASGAKYPEPKKDPTIEDREKAAKKKKKAAIALGALAVLLIAAIAIF
ncbi:MAG: hypothetical protein P8P87_04865 [Crocinitomicaceae bacterium]|nr:hypothetical protein [Crocinitomicaceae bacterium]